MRDQRPIIFVYFAAMILLAAGVIQVVYGQGAAQTIQQINNEFPISVVINESGGNTARALLTAIIDPTVESDEALVWGNTMKANIMDNKIESEKHQSVTMDTKAYLTPLTARVRDLDDDIRLRTIAFNDGLGEFSFSNIDKPGIYILDIMVKGQQSGHIGIYETILYKGKDVKQDDLKIMQLVDSLTPQMMIRFSNVNMTKVNQ